MENELHSKVDDERLDETIDQIAGMYDKIVDEVIKNRRRFTVEVKMNTKIRELEIRMRIVLDSRASLEHLLEDELLHSWSMATSLVVDENDRMFFLMFEHVFFLVKRYCFLRCAFIVLM